MLKTVDLLCAEGGILSAISELTWTKLSEKDVENESNWPAYKICKLREKPGSRSRWIWAPERGSAAPTGNQVSYINPFSREHVGLFLKFAHWFDQEKMEMTTPNTYGIQTLDTKANARAAVRWAREYGVLGLGRNPNESHSVASFSPSSREIAARRLGAHHLYVGGTASRAYRMSPRGGEHESVEEFVMEAGEASAVLKLYAAATAKTLYKPAITRFMSNERLEYAYPRGMAPSYARLTEREDYSRDDESARGWALGVVQETVHRKIENDVYPILTGDRGAYGEGWGFKSLLGAMWLQMRMFVLGDKSWGQCPRCNNLFPKSRRDKTYCGNTCSNQATSARAYDLKKQHQQKVREATKRRLKGTSS